MEVRKGQVILEVHVKEDMDDNKEEGQMIEVGIGKNLETEEEILMVDAVDGNAKLKDF